MLKALIIFKDVIFNEIVNIIGNVERMKIVLNQSKEVLVCCDNYYYVLLILMKRTNVFVHMYACAKIGKYIRMCTFNIIAM